MKPVWIAAAMLALSPVALAQGGHDSHDHGDKPAAESGAAGGTSCMAGKEGMPDCKAGMEGQMMTQGGNMMDHDGMKMGDGMMMDHDGMKMDGDGMMMGQDGMKMDQMGAGDCDAKHEAKGHDPADHCPKTEDQEAGDEAQ
ncbi:MULTISPECIES: hypothetical protein [unclassified Hyphomonas]|uniref:hypothetical protein n=1 Tax=unclassified Hyphomonas TaxID=2630699 RepID=UPI000458B33A|nr:MULTISPECIES: hypothetical protein [unclassified Hyphomonas]KCZ46607.1 hypothetical protein HY17_07640 [Hyphomonas sp. CY54-11-8]